MTNHSNFCNIVTMYPEELKSWREKHSLSQEALAVLLNVTRPCVTQWESGVRKIPAFLHLALKCLKVKKGGERKEREKKTKREKEVKR